MALGIFPHAALAKQDIHVYIDDEEVPFEEPAYLLEERLFIPLRFIVEALEAEAVWDQEQHRVDINTANGDELSFTIDNKQMTLNGKSYVMDVAPFIKQGRVYLPVRHVAEILHAEVTWSNEQQSAYFKKVPLYTIVAGDTLHSISEAIQSTVDLIKERNGLSNDGLIAGHTLKIIIPSMLKSEEEDLLKAASVKDTLDEADLYLLAQIIEVEAGHESFKGQVAVGNVILNRVENKKFPNSIRDVIYAPNQFGAAANGTLSKVKPEESALKAAREAMKGTNYVKGALYFLNPNHGGNTFFNNLSFVADIGNHRFKK